MHTGYEREQQEKGVKVKDLRYVERATHMHKPGKRADLEKEWCEFCSFAQQASAIYPLLGEES